MTQSFPLVVIPCPTVAVPSLIADARGNAARRYLEFFTAHLRNPGTRAAYGHAVTEFCIWCESHRIRFEDVEPIVVAAYIESLTRRLSAPTVKLHLAAIRMLCDYLVTGGIMSNNPAAPVRGPKHVVKKGKTPILCRWQPSIEPVWRIGWRECHGMMAKLQRVEVCWSEGRVARRRVELAGAE